MRKRKKGLLPGPTDPDYQEWAKSLAMAIFKGMLTDSVLEVRIRKLEKKIKALQLDNGGGK